MVFLSQMENEAIFRQWVIDHSDALYRYCMQRLQDENVSKDLLQETFLVAWRNFKQYKREVSVKNWLFLILKTRLLDHYRRSHTRAKVENIEPKSDELSFFDEEDHWRRGMYPKQWNVDFSNRVETQEFQKIFQLCNKKLKHIQSMVFVMKYVDDMDSDEICQQLGITSSNYWVLLHRAKVQLRACLEKNWLHQ